MDSYKDGRTIPTVEEKIMAKLSEGQESSKIRRLSSEVGASLGGICDVQELRRCQRNKKNAAKKKYHHNLGQGGYTSAMPKWDKKEAELREKGVIPEPIREEWELRARNWFLGHGCEYDEVTGDIVESDGVRVPGRDGWKC